jgi:hypothetical protein
MGYLKQIAVIARSGHVQDEKIGAKFFTAPSADFEFSVDRLWELH